MKKEEETVTFSWGTPAGYDGKRRKGLIVPKSMVDFFVYLILIAMACTVLSDYAADKNARHSLICSSQSWVSSECW